MSTSSHQTETRQSASSTSGGGAHKSAGDGKKRKDSPGAAMTGMAETMQAAGDGMWKSSRAFSEEAAHFAARRAERYHDYFEDLACCQTPTDAMHAATRAAQTFMQDYIDEFSRMSEMAMSSMQEVSARAKPGEN
ncbi:hypothetical protein DDZ18_02565 [Marinicauda salina]|jgi:hypothetical protein|uniref:Phasin domain-containing protein n=1 Tax=Marinicauda salina TaxID=2135793 RepID=A0A2U2BWY2_9PROT|nr:phasin family protein [Marinicauda salina]PWE18507.1 hypothetical protein DDZ18_02565 [Marinicauda salina]